MQDLEPTPTHRRRITWAAEDGSLPFALLAIIVLSGVMATVAASAIRSAGAVRFDEEYTEVVQAADAAAQQGESRLLRVHSPATLEAVAVPAGCSPSTWDSCPVHESGALTIDGIATTWELRKVATLAWQSRATATGPNMVERTVVVDVVDRPLFFIAAFSDQGLKMAGSNAADSYGSTGWYTGNGIVASNETIRLNGSSTGVDAVHLYNWDNNPDISRCTHTGGSDCDDVRAMPDAIMPSARIGAKLEVGVGKDLETAFIDDHLTTCPAPLPDYTASTYDGGSGVLGTIGSTTTLCFENVTFDRDVIVQGTVEIYVYGDMAMTNHVTVNCGGGCAAGSSTPDARTLSIYVDGADDPVNDPPTQVVMGNGSTIVGGIYAPESECKGNPSNAQSSVFGSMICQTISNQGGWSFHYDDRLRERGSGNYARSSWREEAL